MVNHEHLDILKQGVEAWNQWREEHPDRRSDLRGADLRAAVLAGADLRGADLKEAHLKGADLRAAHLRGADLREAHLELAHLELAHLELAHLRGADLSGADLSGATLTGADLGLANLNGANLRGANLTGATLTGADLAEAGVALVQYLDRKQSFWTRFYPRSIMRGKYQAIRVASCSGNAIFKRDAEDQDFLDTLEFQWKGTWRIGLFWAWRLIDYGRSMLAAFVLAGILVVFFGSLYLVFPSLVSYSASHPKTWFSPYYFSIVTFTTLGFGDVTANGWLGEMVVSLQVISGYLTLGLLISILANKVARRS